MKMSLKNIFIFIFGFIFNTYVSKPKFCNNQSPLKELGVNSKINFQSNRDNRIVICCIAKLENHYINDWVEYHINLGFDKIYIYDNNDINESFIGNYIDIDYRDRIYIKRIPYIRNFQESAYTNFYIKYKNQFSWAFFIDVDEYLVFETKKYSNVFDFVNDPIFAKADTIRINWQTFGDDGKIKDNIYIPIYQRIKQKVITDKNYVFKSFVKGNLGNDIIIEIHFAHRNKGKRLKNFQSNGIIQNRGNYKVNVTNPYVYLAHFTTKTLSEFINQKFKRQYATTIKKINFDFYFKYNNKTQEKLDYIKKFSLKI